MKLTPQDILTQQFNVKVKGYDRDEVEDFLKQVARALEREILEGGKLKKDIDKARETLAKFEKKDEILRETLISAQRFSTEIKTNAEREAELIVKEAEIKGEEIINSAMDRHKTLKEEIRNLKFKRKEIESDIINMLNSLKELIGSYRQDDEDFEKVEYISR